MNIVERAYSLIVLGLSPLVAIAFLFSRRGRARLGERFGFWSSPDLDQTLWIHAASNGEWRGVRPLVAELNKQFPEQRLLITATSISAFATKDEDPTSIRRLLPFDQECFYKRALSKGTPRALLIAETEIWPELLRFAQARKIPVYLINARISEYTADRYRLLTHLMPNLFAGFKKVLVADGASRERFVELGASDVVLTGNMKYEVMPSVASDDQREVVRAQFPFSDLPILVLGSLRPGEEGGWIAAIKEKRARNISFGCILAPRHLEKVEYFVRELRQAGLRVALFTEQQKHAEKQVVDVVVLDCFGQLETCYSIAALVFIGATLVDIGGHNPLEAAAYGVPIVIGPYDTTVREITQQLEQRGGLVRIQPGENCSPLIERMMITDSALVQIGIEGRRVWEDTQGAAKKTFAILQEEGIFSRAKLSLVTSP